MKLKRYNFGYRNHFVLFVFILSVALLITLIVNTSLAKYKVTHSINIAKGTINYSPSDFSLMGIYTESDNGYEQSDTIPESGYTLNSEESYCKLGDTKQDVTISYDFNTKALSIIPMTTKGMKCYLYFDVSLCPSGASACETIMVSKTINKRTDFSAVLTSDNTGTIYSADDDDGTSYYYAGALTDNWVKFANLYWRIIRFNGDGTIRLIYSGTSASTAGEDTQYTTSAFNSSYNNNKYVGFMYTSGSVHGTGTKSTILVSLEMFYTSELASYADYLDTNAGFCNDRTPYTDTAGSTSGGGTGTINTYYADYIRLMTNKTPSLKCTNSSDLFTKSGATKGNQALTYPVGLITADEVAYAGGVYGTNNTSYYLYTGQYYWTLSPCRASSSAYMFLVNTYGFLDYYGLGGTRGVRPVINLKSDTEFKAGSLGTVDSPYVVVGAE